MSPPRSPGDSGDTRAHHRASGPGRKLRGLGQAWEKLRGPEADGSGAPAGSAPIGLTEQRKALVNRYTVDADAKTAVHPRRAAVVAVPDAHTPDGAAVFDGAREWPSERIGVGTLSALLVLSSAAGLVLVSAGYALSRSGHTHGSLLFWLGLLAIFLPVTARLTSTTATRNERAGLLVLLGLASYLVKVFRDPFRFLYADEFVHQFNALSILSTHKLFAANPILAATPAYPGLEAPTAALSALTGMSTFAAGLVVVGAARLILMLALFLLYETVTGSGRIAGLAAALYAASPHFLFFIADFSYESLALPIAILAFAATLRARPPSGGRSRAWLVVALVLTAGVVVTHHMTSYALIVTLLAICLVPLPWLDRRLPRPWSVALVAIAFTAGWLVLVGRETVGYLSPVIVGAVRETVRTVQGEAQVRQLFQSSGGAASGPAWEHYVGFGSAAVTALALPFGALLVWRRYRHSPTAIVCVFAAAAYVCSLVLRLVPGAWVIAARASEFLFIGAGLILALFAFWALERFPGPGMRVGLVTAAAVLIVGGVISTTPSSTRLAEPFRVSAHGGNLEPQAATAAQWVSDVLGPGNRLAAGTADGRFLLVAGRQHVFTGNNPPITKLLKTKALHPWEVRLLRRLQIRYVVTNSQPSGADDANGYYFFPRKGQAHPGTKFRLAGAAPIYDSGDIVVFDLGAGLRTG